MRRSSRPANDGGETRRDAPFAAGRSLRGPGSHELACGSWKDGKRQGFTRVISGIDPTGRLLLEGIRLTSGPVKLTLEVQSEENAPRGQYADIEVIEYGMLNDQESINPVGGLTIRFEH